jgi:Domain of unknown function (DUF397)
MNQLVWRKATKSGAQNCVEVAWRKATRSGGTNCVEVAAGSEGDVLMRNSRHPDGPALSYTPPEWAAFIDGVKNGEFDDLIG